MFDMTGVWQEAFFKQAIGCLDFLVWSALCWVDAADLLALLFYWRMSCWVYGSIFRHSFVRYDDMMYVVGNRQIRKRVTWEDFLGFFLA